MLKICQLATAAAPSNLASLFTLPAAVELPRNPRNVWPPNSRRRRSILFPAMWMPKQDRG